MCLLCPRSFHPELSWLSLLSGCCWLMLSLPSIKTLRCFTAQQLPSQALPSPYCFQGLFCLYFPCIVFLFLRRKILHLSLENFIPVGPYLQPVQATLDGSLLSAMSAVHSILVCSENLRRLHSHFFKIMVLNRAGARAPTLAVLPFLSPPDRAQIH